MADEELTNSEIRFLNDWLEQRYTMTSSFPGNIIHQRIKDVLEDGVIPEEERSHLVDTLNLLIGDRLEDLAEQVDLTELWFDEVGLIWGTVQTLEEVADDPQAEAIGLFPTVTHAERGDYRSVRIPLRIHGSDVGPQGPAPECGEHTAAILEDMGLADEEVKALVAAGAIQL